MTSKIKQHGTVPSDITIMLAFLRHCRGGDSQPLSANRKNLNKTLELDG